MTIKKAPPYSFKPYFVFTKYLFIFKPLPLKNRGYLYNAYTLTYEIFDAVERHRVPDTRYQYNIDFELNPGKDIILIIFGECGHANRNFRYVHYLS